MEWYIKYRSEFTDIKGVYWKVEILEEAASQGTIEELQCTGSPLFFEWYGDDDIFLQPIMGSKMTLNIWNDEDFKLSDLFSSKMFKRKVNVYHDNDTLYWTGYILPEQYTEPYNEPPMSTEIIATDGLGLLKDFDFNDLRLDKGYGDTRQKMSVVIYDILSLIKAEEFTEYINVYSDSMDSGVGDSPLDQLGIDPVVFIGDNCYDVLNEMLGKLWGAGIKQERGEFNIFRIKELKQNTIYGRKFTSGTAKTSVSKSLGQEIKRGASASNIKDVEGGSLTFIPQASKHIINYDTGFKQSILKSWEFREEDFSLGEIDGWNRENVDIKPLGQELGGEEKGVFIELANYTSTRKYIEQSVPVQQTSYQLRLDLRYLLFNKDNVVKTAAPEEAQYAIWIDDGAGTVKWWNLSEGWVDDIPIPVVNWYGYNNLYEQHDVEIWYKEQDWKTLNIVINQIPFSGTLTIKLPAYTEFDLETSELVEPATMFMVYQDVKFYFTPPFGGSEQGIGYECNPNDTGQIVESERYLGDGFTDERLIRNQLIMYKGVMNEWDGSEPINSGSALHPPKWSTRGGNEEKMIHELINDELCEQYERPRQIIDLPVWIDDDSTYISQIDRLEDSFNKVGGVNRKFHVSIFEYDVRNRDYRLILTEII